MEATMRGDVEVLDVLSAVLTAELTAINQYFIHAKMNENWGYSKIAENKRNEAISEMKHADRVIERILFLEGTPNMQRLNPVRIGENVPEQHALDLELENDAVKRLNDGIARRQTTARASFSRRSSTKRKRASTTSRRSSESSRRSVGSATWPSRCNRAGDWRARDARCLCYRSRHEARRCCATEAPGAGVRDSSLRLRC